MRATRDRCRLGTCANASAGRRYGTSGTKIGNAYRTWACSEAAVLCLRANPAGQTYLGRLEKQHGQGKVLTVLAHTRARRSLTGCHATRRSICTSSSPASGAERASLAPHGLLTGYAWHQCAESPAPRRHGTRMRMSALHPCSLCVAGRRALAPVRTARLRQDDVGCPSPAPGPHGRTGPG
jgi:hypothetical protein